MVSLMENLLKLHDKPAKCPKCGGYKFGSCERDGILTSHCNTYDCRFSWDRSDKVTDAKCWIESKDDLRKQIKDLEAKVTELENIVTALRNRDNCQDCPFVDGCSGSEDMCVTYHKETD